MTLRIEWRPGASRDILGIPVKDADRVVKAIRSYVETGQGDVKVLKG